MILLADGGILTKLACDSTDCLSYIISLLDILTVLYLSYCASFRVNKGVRIFGWVWAAVVVAATIAIIAIHTCLFTLVSALFTALVLMALFGVTFEAITAEKKKAEADAAAQETQPTAPFVCPLTQCGCLLMQRQPVAEAPAEETPAEETPAEEAPVEEAPAEEAPAEEAPAEEPAEEVTADVAEEEPLSLGESLALARETVNASAVVNKKYVADYLTASFGSGVECNMRGNYTKTGLPLADTHFARSESGKKCFIYVYETDSAVVLLVRLTEEYAEGIRAGGHRIIRSAFPKSKDAWFSIIADDSYTEEDVQKILIDACNMAK